MDPDVTALLTVGGVTAVANVATTLFIKPWGKGRYGINGIAVTPQQMRRYGLFVNVGTFLISILLGIVGQLATMGAPMGTVADIAHFAGNVLVLALVSTATAVLGHEFFSNAGVTFLSK